MKNLSLILFSVIFLLASFNVAAEDEPVFKVTPSGRVLIDGALYASPQKELFGDGMAIPEARVGVKAYYGKWSTMIDVGFAYSKIGLRNMWVEYSFNPGNSIRVGNFIHQFGLQSTTTSLKCTYEQPIASALFTPGLQLGAMFTHHSPTFFAAASFHVESSALNNVMNYPQFIQQGYGLLTRLVWRKVQERPADGVINIGISGGFATPQRRLIDDQDVHDGFAMSATFPTKVAQVQAIGTTVANSMNLFKLTPELLLSKGRLALESQYFFQRINRRMNLPGFNSQSVYVTLRGIIFGGTYSYDSAAAQPVNPNKNALELVADYNYATLSDLRANIFGGRENSFNLTLNYYFNKYFTARLNYTYTHTWNREGHDPVSLNGFQLRIMALF